MLNGPRSTIQVEVTPQPTRAFPQHRKVGPCFTRPAYRDGRRKTAIKVFTIATESAYLLLFGVPSVNLDQQLKDRCRQIGPLQQLTKLIDYPEKELFTDVFLAKFDSVQTASFYGGSLHVCYAPEYETVAETRVKLHVCRRDNARIARKAEHEYSQRLLGCTSSHMDNSPSNIVQEVVCASDAIVSSTSTDAGHSALTIVSPSACDQAADFSSGDALDDARNYWLKRGMDWMQLGAVPPVQNLPAVSGASKIGNDKALVREPTMGPNGRPLPLPVLQALSWRPYRAPVCEPEPVESDRAAVESNTLSTPSSFVPRCLRLHTVSSAQANSKTFGRTNSEQTSQKPITVGELKRLAFKLGPEQGPSLPPVLTRQSTGYKRSACDSKRIVFHDQSKKLKRADDDNETSNPHSM